MYFWIPSSKIGAFNCWAYFRRIIRRLLSSVIPGPQARRLVGKVIKIQSGGNIFESGVNITAREAISYALSLPISTLVSGIDSFEVLEQNLEIARNFEPLGEQQILELRKRMHPEAYQGRHEHYKR